MSQLIGRLFHSESEIGKNVFSFLLILFVVVAIWIGLLQLYPQQLFSIPTPIDVLNKLLSQLDRFILHASFTLKEMVGGLIFASLISFPLGWFMYQYSFIRTMSQSFFILVQCLPMFALAPIMITCFGWSFVAILIPTTLMIVFPLTMNIYRGIKATPQEYVDFFRVHNATKWQILTKLRLPYALPHIFSGFRIASAIAGVGAIAGEFAGAQGGLGVYIQECRRDFEIEGIFAALFCLVALTLSLYGLIAFLELVFVKGNSENAND